MERPKLSRELDSNIFRSFYYLKEELVSFCRENGIPSSGGKVELTERIAHFLDTGELTEQKIIKHKARQITNISRTTLIESDFVCTEIHRAFFRKEIGKSFSFNVAFQKWLKSNSGKTYEDAIEAYYRILEEKKTTKTTMMGHNRYEKFDLAALK